MSELYNKSFYKKHAIESFNSAEIIVPLILKVFPAASVNDVGCGTGAWLHTFHKMGVRDVRGWDANSMDLNEYAVDKSRIHTGCDFSSSDFSIDCCADICISLEVAEHLPETIADNYVRNLINCSHVVIFSAAYPGQTGVNHINEQPPWYWRNKFNQNGYLEIDFLRPLIWENERVAWWYRQNITAYVHTEYIKKNQNTRALFKQYGQKNSPHRLTLVNEWILKRQLDDGIIDGKHCSQLGRPDSKRGNSLIQKDMMIELANHLLGMNLLPDDNRQIAQLYAKYNHSRISNAFLVKAQPKITEPVISQHDNKKKESSLPEDSGEPIIKKDQEHDYNAIDFSFLERIPTHLSIKEKTELHRLARLKARDNAVFVELGSYLGGSSCYIANAIKSSKTDTRFYCIDTWQNEGMAEGLRDTYAEFTQNIAPFQDIIVPLRGKTDQVAGYFKKSIDLLFIDAEHSYASVSQDIHNWIPLLKDDAIIAFHDYTWFEGVRRAVLDHIKPLEKESGQLIDSLYITSIDTSRINIRERKAKLLFIMPALERIYYYNPELFAYESHTKLMPNVSGLFIGSYLQKYNIDVNLFDFVEYYRKDNGLSPDKLWRHLKTRIESYSPDLIAMNVWPQTVELSRYYTSLIKKEFPRLTVVWGGHFVALANEKELMASPADLFVKYGGEIPLQKLLAGTSASEVDNVLFKEKNGIVSTKEKIFTDFNYELDLDWSLIDTDTYFKRVMDLEGAVFANTAMVVFNRGCPNRCNFCVAQNGTFPKPVWLSNSSLSQEIVKLYRRYGIEHVHITDDLTFRNKRNLDEFIEKFQITEAFNNVKFTISTRIDRLKDKDYLKNLEKLGVVSVRLGVESDSETILEKMDKKTSSAYNWTVLRNSYGSSIKHIFMMISGYFEESRTDAVRSIKFLMRNLNINSRYWVSEYQLYRGTQDYRYHSHRRNDANFTAMPDGQAVRYDRFMRYVESLHNVRFSMKSLVDIYCQDDPQGKQLMALSFKSRPDDWFYNLSVEHNFFIEQNRLWRKYHVLENIPPDLLDEFHDVVLMLYLSKRLTKLRRLIHKHGKCLSLNSDLLELMAKLAFYDGKPDESIALINTFGSQNRGLNHLRRFIAGFEAFTRQHCQYLLAENIPFLKYKPRNPYLSVIIPTRDRAELLGKTLQSLTTQTYPQELFEVIVIDNGSSDHTAAVCKKYQRNFKHFKYVFDRQPGLHVGRHRGMKTATGDILVYCDDDICALSSWLEGVADGFRRHDIVMVGGKILPEMEASPPQWYEGVWNRCQWGRWLGWYSLLDFGDDIIEIDPRYVWGCNFSVRKDVLMEVEGFHPDSLPKHLLKYRGDGETAVSDAIAKKGYKALYHPRAAVYHWVSKERLTPEYLYERAYAQGISDSYTTIRSSGKPCERKVFEQCNDEIQNVIQKGHCDGFNFHQKEAHKDPGLLKWIMRRNYMGIGPQGNNAESGYDLAAEKAAAI